MVLLRDQEHDVWANESKEKRKTKALLETGSSGNDDDMEEEYVVDEVQYVASSTLFKEKKTEIPKFIKEMAPGFFIYDVDFRNLVGDHKLGAGKDLSRKIDLVLMNAFYNLWRDRNDSYE